jgi:hypothetical protein
VQQSARNQFGHALLAVVRPPLAVRQRVLTGAGSESASSAERGGEDEEEEER